MSNQSEQKQVFKAPEFDVNQWIDSEGDVVTKPIKLSDFKGKFKIVYCFQSWCEGCHTKGFPDLKKMVASLEENDSIVFLAVQTVFEGLESNTYKKMVATQKQYDLKIPFGHDPGSHGRSGSNIMFNYKTGGTPWFLFIDTHDNVVFSDFHLNPAAAIEFLKTI
jgi:thiol-disulfide isomerase/thioredoxin